MTRSHRRPVTPVSPMTRMVRVLDRVLGAPDLLASCFIGLALIVIMGTLFLNAVGRYLAGFSLLGGAEAARYLMVWMTFIGMYILVRKRAHIAIDILPRFAPFSLTRWIGVATGLLGTVMMVYMLRHGGALADRMLAGGQSSPVLPIPKGILHLSMPVGAGLSAFAFLHMMLSYLFDPESERARMTPDDDIARQFDANVDGPSAATPTADKHGEG